VVQELRLVSPNSDRPSKLPARLPGGSRERRLSSRQIADRSTRSALIEALSREVRTTLALVSGYSQTLLHLDLDDGERDRCLARISVASAHVAELTDEMLSVAASENDVIPISQPVSIGSLLSHLGRQLAEEADPPRLDAELPAELPLASADPGWIVHVLRNLVTTAATGSADGRSARLYACSTRDWVVVSVQRGGEQAGAELSSSDSSIGPNWRRSAASAAKSAGRAGSPDRQLGSPGSLVGDLETLPSLDYCRELVEAQGGRIWLDETASGVRVSFSLPRYWPEEPSVERRGADDLVGALEL